VFCEISPRFTGGSGARAALGFSECEAALRLFLLEEDGASVAARLRYSEEAVCLRYMTDEVAPRAAIERLDRGAPIRPQSRCCPETHLPREVPSRPLRWYPQASLIPAARRC
jgi:hypothetical protein